jgi:hypothetical protein
MIMKWEFHYHEEPNYLEVIVSGTLSHDELNKMAVERWSELRKYHCRKILFDFTQITSMLDTIDIYHRPEQSEKVGVLRQNYAAAVVPVIYIHEFRFMETVYKNRGFDLNIFDEKEAAINYLAGADRK